MSFLRPLRSLLRPRTLVLPAVLAALGALAGAAPLAAAIEGVVTDPAGRPIEGARIELIGEEAPSIATTSRGRFVFPRAEPPALVLVVHPRFEEQAIQVTAETPQPLEVVLAAKREIYEEIVVSAGREARTPYQPVSVAAAAVEPEEQPAPPSSVLDLVETVPGVAENGQGGAFQVYSVRGVSGQRVLTLVSGMRIVSERRAGQSASFVDPQLLAAAEVVRGPSSSYYGSGALGGVVQVFPLAADGPRVATGWSSQGDERYLAAATGGEGWTVGIAGREVDDSENARGESLTGRYERLSAVLAKEWRRGERTWELLVVPALGRDIGKPNADQPARTTLYPDEEHLLVRAGVAGDDWRLYAYAHPNRLETEVVRSGETERIERVENEAFDFGINGQWERELGERTSARYGLDYFGRRGVSGTERDFRRRPGSAEEGPLAVTRSLDDAEEDEVAAYGALRHPLGPVTIEGGGRVTWLRQANRGEPERTDAAVAGFVGATLPIEGGFELAANVGTGLRFPSLSERFFSGTTGRGEVVKNPDLDPERAVSGDLGLRYYGRRLYLATYVFRTEIDDYIERIDVEPGVRTFVNLTSGTLDGFELDGFYELTPEVTLFARGQHLEGQAADGTPLADVPADRFELGGRWRSGPWRAAAKLQHRRAADDPGPGEQPTPSAELLSASAEYRLTEELWLSVFGSNLLDELYLPSADDRSVPGPGRSLGVGLRWRG